VQVIVPILFCFVLFFYTVLHSSLVYSRKEMRHSIHTDGDLKAGAYNITHYITINRIPGANATLLYLARSI
jgi:hypothetical protein